MAFVADAGGQGALLAPTDLLARQHAQTLAALLEPLGHDVMLLTGIAAGGAQRREALELSARPSAVRIDGRSRGRVVVGTHALVQEARRLRRPAARRRRRAAPLRRRGARGAGGEGPRAARAADDRDAHPAHAGPDHPRRPGRVRPAHAAAGPAEDRDRRPRHRRADAPARRPTRARCRCMVQEVAAGQRAFVVVPLVEEDADSGARSVERGRRSWSAANWAEAARGRPALRRAPLPRSRSSTAR